MRQWPLRIAIMCRFCGRCPSNAEGRFQVCRAGLAKQDRRDRRDCRQDNGETCRGRHGQKKATFSKASSKAVGRLLTARALLKSFSYVRVFHGFWGWGYPFSALPTCWGRCSCARQVSSLGALSPSHKIGLIALSDNNVVPSWR